MGISFMLQPEGEAYWRVAGDAENSALNNFCNKNYVKFCSFVDDGYLPVACYRGVVKVKGQEYNLYGKLYERFQNAQYDVFADEDGETLDSKAEARHFVPLFIKHEKDRKMSARPYKERFIDPILRPDFPYRVPAQYEQHNASRRDARADPRRRTSAPPRARVPVPAARAEV